MGYEHPYALPPEASRLTECRYGRRMVPVNWVPIAERGFPGMPILFEIGCVEFDQRRIGSNSRNEEAAPKSRLERR